MSAEDLQKYALTIKSLDEDEFFKWISSVVTQTMEGQFLRGYVAGFHSSISQQKGEKECECWICTKQPMPEEVIRSLISKAEL